MKPATLHLHLISSFLLATTATLYTTVFIPPGNITSFTSYLTTPPTSKNLNIPTGAQNIYTALQPADSVVMAQVPLVNNLAGTAWNMGPTFCCGENGENWTAPKMLVPSIMVIPGTLVYTSQSLAPETNTWSIGWADGSNETNPLPGGMVNLPAYPSLTGPFTKAIFGLDIVDNVSWDFGAVTWSNIQIVVATNSTDESWCVGIDAAGGPIRNNVNYAIAGRSIVRTDTQQTCTIQGLVLNLPIVTGA